MMEIMTSPGGRVGTPDPALGLERQPLRTRHRTNTIGV